MSGRFPPVIVGLVLTIGCGGGGGAMSGGGGRGGAGASGDGGLAGQGGGGGDASVVAPPTCGNGIVESGEACDGTRGCASGQVCGAVCACKPGPTPANNSGALIGAALASGRIDRFTSLLYRAYAFAGDAKLPPEFDGDFTLQEDNGLFIEISRMWGSLTAAQQTALRPYIVRPTDPASVFSAPATAAASLDDDGLLASPPAVSDTPCPRNSATGAADWRFTETTHFVIWSCGGGSLSADPSAGKRAAVAAMADEIWRIETAALTVPRPDEWAEGPAPTNRIDVYLLPAQTCKMRNGVCRSVKGGESRAAAQPDAPCDARNGPLTSSGFLLMRLDLTPSAAPAAGVPSEARSDFAHEFFHLLSYALNLEAQGGGCASGLYSGVSEVSWLSEASAVWAEWAYARNDFSDYRQRRFLEFQSREPSTDSLLDSRPGVPSDPAYQAYVYPLFVCQQNGGRTAFEGFWKNNSAAHSPAALNDVLHVRFPFKDSMRDFGVRMLNISLTPGNPAAPFLATVDPGALAEFPPISQRELWVLPAAADFPAHVDLAPLATQYQHFEVKDPVRWVDVDLREAPANLALDAIVNVKGTWSRRRIPGGRFTFCRGEPADDITEFFLLITNTGHHVADKVSKDYEVRARLQCPGDALTGTITSKRLVTSHVVFQSDTTDQYERLDQTWTLGDSTTLNVGGLSMPALNTHWSASYEQHDSTATSLAGRPCQGQVVLSLTDASGRGSHVTPILVAPNINGGLLLSAVSLDVGSFDAQEVSAAHFCDGLVSSSSTMKKITEEIALVSPYLMLFPDAGNPNHFKGEVVVLRETTPREGGSDSIDWVVNWDVTRTVQR